MLLLLRRRRNEAVELGIKRNATVPSIATAVQIGIERAVLTGRHLSAISGETRLRAELKSLGYELDVPSPRITLAATDAARARAVSRSYAERWFRKADAEQVATTKEAAAAASEATESSLERIGVTESSEAFSRSRTASIRVVRGNLFYRVWDAHADACPLCGELEGTIVYARESFPGGEPGSIHPNCLCSFTLLAESEVDGGSLIQAA